MAIPISFLTAVLKKTVIEAGYPRGLTGFLQDYQGGSQDEHLVGVCFMSGGELQEFIDSLKATGFDVARCLAVGEMFRGEWEPCNGIEFTATRSGPMDRGWQASVVPEQGKS